MRMGKEGDDNRKKIKHNADTARTRPRGYHRPLTSTALLTKVVVTDA